jgi:hypothetical protein
MWIKNIAQGKIETFFLSDYGRGSKLYIHARIVSSDDRVIPILNTHLTEQDFRFSPTVPYDIW